MKPTVINHIIRYPIVAFMLWVATTWSWFTIWIMMNPAENALGADIQVLPMIVFCGSCFISSFGLIFKKKVGWIFGYAIVFGICGMFIGEAVSHWNQMGRFTLEDIGWSVLFTGTPLLMGLGMRRLAKTEIERLTRKDYLYTIGIVVLMGASYAISGLVHIS